MNKIVNQGRLIVIHFVFYIQINTNRKANIMFFSLRKSLNVNSRFLYAIHFIFGKSKIVMNSACIILIVVKCHTSYLQKKEVNSHFLEQLFGWRHRSSNIQFENQPKFTDSACFLLHANIVSAAQKVPKGAQLTSFRYIEILDLHMDLEKVQSTKNVERFKCFSPFYFGFTCELKSPNFNVKQIPLIFI